MWAILNENKKIVEKYESEERAKNREKQLKKEGKNVNSKQIIID